jgi:hypothetical protein
MDTNNRSTIRGNAYFKYVKMSGKRLVEPLVDVFPALFVADEHDTAAAARRSDGVAQVLLHTHRVSNLTTYDNVVWRRKPRGSGLRGVRSPRQSVYLTLLLNTIEAAVF